MSELAQGGPPSAAYSAQDRILVDEDIRLLFS